MSTPTRQWAVDVEGNGAREPEIVEVALVAMNGLAPVGEVHVWRVRPRNPVTRDATRIHGIREADLAGAPPMEEAASAISDRLGDAPIVGHNVSVELRLLGAALPKWRPSAAYDTLKLARRLLADERRHGLKHLVEAMGLAEIASSMTDGAKPHSAAFDAAAAALLFERLVAPLEAGRRSALLRFANVLDVAQGSLL